MKNTTENYSEENYPAAPEGYVCLGKGKTFMKNSHFLALPKYDGKEFFSDEPYWCDGENEYLIYYVPINSEIAKLNGLGETKMKKKQEKEKIKVGDEVKSLSTFFRNDKIYKVRAIDKDDVWAISSGGFNIVDKIDNFKKHVKPIEVGSKVKQKGTSVIYHNDIGAALYIHNEHTLVLWHGNKVPNLKRTEDLEVIP